MLRMLGTTWEEIDAEEYARLMRLYSTEFTIVAASDTVIEWHRRQGEPILLCYYFEDNYHHFIRGTR